MEMIKAHPIIGVGLNNATAVVRQYAEIAGMGGVWVFIVHNQFMLVAAETGLIGFAAFAALYAGGIRAAYRAMQSDDVLIRDAAAATFWCLLALIWSLNLDHVAGAMTYAFLFFLFGIASGLAMLTRSQEQAKSAASVSSA
jgi:O-antigen ligase